MKENNEKKLNSKDKKILIIIIVSILCITLLISTSLAMLISNNSSAKKDIYKTGSLTIVFNDENAQNIILNKAKPITDEYAMATIKTYDFTIENEGSTVATYNISLTNEEITTVDNISNEYVKSKIKYQINDRDPQILSEAKGNVLLSGGINPGKTKEFKLRVWLSIDADNKVQNSTYKAQVSISGKAVHYYYDSVAETILSNETPITKTPTFTKGSQDRGLFEMKTINGKIYYYRGSTTSDTIEPDYNINNYVSFGTYKVINSSSTQTKGKPIIWRILRINEDNSITLTSIDTYLVASGQVNWGSTTKSPDYKGSNLETLINDWYSKTFTEPELQQLVLDTNFCNDRSDNYTAVAARLAENNPQPTLECKQKDDIITAKAGLLTVDEIVYSGNSSSSTSNNNTTYLFDECKNFWTMSPSAIDKVYSVVTNIYDNEYITSGPLIFNEAGSENTDGIRPVITLSSSAKVKSGEGTKDSPYVIVP